MATHFVCQSTEPLPHVYQSGLSSLSHGAVSQYEIYNESKKPHTQFPPPGWDFSQTSEEDSLPLVQTVPIPEWKDTSVHPDPDLCITPLKLQPQKSMTVYAHSKPVIDADPLLTLTPEKSIHQGKVYGDKDGVQVKKHRVRFDVEEDAKKWEEEDSVVTQNLQSKCPPKKSPEKVYQPELYGNDSDKFDFTDTNEKFETSRPKQGIETIKYTVGKVNSQPVYIPLTDSALQPNAAESHEKLSQNDVTSTQKTSQTFRSKTVKVIREKPKTDGKSEQPKSIDPIASSVVPEQNGPRRKAKVLRENQSAGEGEYTFPFERNQLEFAGGEEHMFSRPEYNSTLRMKVEAEKLKNSSIDIERALQKKLNMSESTKTSIHEKVWSQERGYMHLGYNSLANKPLFLCVCNTNLFKTQWEKKKLLVMNNFSFFPQFFSSFGDHCAIFLKFEIFVCKLSEFGRV